MFKFLHLHFLQTWPWFLLTSLFLLAPVNAEANYSFVEYEVYEDRTEVEVPLYDHTYYGNLDGFPHNYFITLEESSSIFVELHEFDSKTPTPDKNIILVKINPRGRVTEMTRLNAKETEWVEMKDAASRDMYMQGGSYSAELESGNYLLEVNSPQNAGRYALIIKATESANSFNPFTELTRVYQLKLFLDKPGLSVLGTPIYFVPLLLLLIFVVYYRFYRKNRQKT